MNTDRFRFRVWDKEEKEYLQEGALIDSRTGFIVGYLDADCFIIEQCTGMKDRKGKLIFEGDVCRNIRNGEILSVAWHHNFAGFIWNKKQDDSCLYDFGALFRVFDKFEIIGNIHEMEKDK